MKNTFFILFAGLLLSLSTQAQKKKATPVKQLKVPENVSTSFKSQFTAVNDSQWDKNYSGNYIASFTNGDNLKQPAEYNQSH